MAVSGVIENMFFVRPEKPCSSSRPCDPTAPCGLTGHIWTGVAGLRTTRGILHALRQTRPLLPCRPNLRRRTARRDTEGGSGRYCPRGTDPHHILAAMLCSSSPTALA
jgi:hypothetical protein